MKISFKRLTEADMDLLHFWLNCNHVADWYCKGVNFDSIENVKKEYLNLTLDSSLTKSYIICINDIKTGYIQTYRIIDYPEPENIVAIKSYMKVGFKYLKTIQLPDEEDPEYLMILEKH